MILIKTFFLKKRCLKVVKEYYCQSFENPQNKIHFKTIVLKSSEYLNVPNGPQKTAGGERRRNKDWRYNFCFKVRNNEAQ